MAGARFTIRVDLGDSPTIPMRIEVASRDMVGKVADRVAREIGQASGSRRIAAATTVAYKAEDKALIVIGAGVPFARIRDRGGTIHPKNAKVLRFADGGYRPRARQEGNHYIERGARAAADGINADFSSCFATI